MKAFVFALAIVLLAGSTFAAGRSLNQFTSGTCTTFGSLSIVVKHGSCSGSARASCETFADAEVAIGEAFPVGVSFAPCSSVFVQAQVQAFATAIAEVYTEALAQVECDGLGFGCAFSLASGDSFATAYASSFAKAVAAVLTDKLSAVCVAKLESLAAGIAKAAATANTKACVNGSGSAFAFREQFIEATTKVLTEAIATVTAEICVDGKEKAECTAEVSGSSESEIFAAGGASGVAEITPGTNPFDGDNTAVSAGESSSDARKIKPCDGDKKPCCTGSCTHGFLGPDLTGEHNLILVDFLGSPQCWCH